MLSSSAFAATSPISPSPPRRHIRIDDNWRFLRLPLDALAPSGTEIGGWRFKPAPGVSSLDNVSALPDDIGSGGYQPIAVGADAFSMSPGFAWFQAELGNGPSPAAGMRRVVEFQGFDDNACVFVNGVFLRRQIGYNVSFVVDVTRLWKPGGPNIVTALVQNTGGGGGISSPAHLRDQPLHPKPAPPPAQALPGFNDTSWRIVHLPHDYVVEGTFTPSADTGHGSLPTPPAWYRKVIMLPASERGKCVSLDFDGVYRDARVYLNGMLLGEHPSGYGGFSYDVSGKLRWGQPNTLAVSVDPSRYEGWFYEGGGIYRHVWLTVTAPIHIARHGVYVTTRLPEPNRFGVAKSATVNVQTSVVAASGTAALPAPILQTAVIDEAGRTIATAASTVPALSAGQPSVVRQSLEIIHPRLWWTTAPHLYRLKSELMRGGKVMDNCDTAFGVRTLRFDPMRGFFLNGRRTEIQGTCNHQDFAGVGIGIPDNLLYWRIAKLKAMGCNAYRCSHNPVAPELLDACDRLGMLVMDENRHLGDTYHPKSDAGTRVGGLSDLREMLLADRNHPSIIMWSLCNEEFSVEGNAKGAQLFAAMKRVAREYDTTRPYTCAMDSGFGNGISDVEDLQGFNYRVGNYDSFHAAHPQQPCFGSETSSEVTTRGEYADNPAKGYVAAYDKENAAVSWGQSAEDAWQPIAARPWMEGGFVWTGFDYKGEPTPYGWPDINSNFGILDEAGIPKDAYYYYQAVWGSKPVVHIVPSDWNLAGREGKPIDVWCYSNTESVELFLNGKSLGSKPMPRCGHVEWSVPYQPGTLRAEGTTSYSVTATDHVETTGAPAALHLSVDSAASPTLIADGEEAVVLDVAVVDAKGRVVPNAANSVSFQARGAAKLIGSGNGDPSDHTPDHSASRRAFHGRCIVIVQAGQTPGQVTVTAASSELAPASVTLKVLPAQPGR